MTVEERTNTSLIKRMLPRSLFGRSLLIIVTPLILMQVVLAFIFYESHWDKVSRRLATDLAGDIGAVVELASGAAPGMTFEALSNLAYHRMGLRIALLDGEILPNTPHHAPLTEDARLFTAALDERVTKPVVIDLESDPKDIVVFVQLSDGVLKFTTTRKRLFSSTTYIFVLWMIGTSLILFAVATTFMRNQVRPIRRLAEAAKAFGKGRNTPSFKPEGATEVRQAANAFLEMRERIQRHIGERTKMLAGVSHDLRTPLTRMKLQLAMLGDGDDVEDLKGDVADMSRMLDGYLAFARGEGGEKPVETNLNEMLQMVVGQARRKGGLIDLHMEEVNTLPLKPDAFTRCVTNIIDNAMRYATHVSVRVGRREEAIEITIDDDGPGIPEAHRADVFRPFFRIEDSRNPETGGVGLGMSIARDVMRGHGGEIVLGDSPSGGLRVRLRLPL